MDDFIDIEEVERKSLRPARLRKLRAQLKARHWELLQHLVTITDDEVAQLPARDMATAKRLVRLGLAELVDEPGFRPGHVVTAAGRELFEERLASAAATS